MPTDPARRESADLPIEHPTMFDPVGSPLTVLRVPTAWQMSAFRGKADMTSYSTLASRAGVNPNAFGPKADIQLHGPMNRGEFCSRRKPLIERTAAVGASSVARWHPIR